MKHRPCNVLVVTAILIAASMANGATGKWTQTTAGDFGTGKLEQIAVLSTGRIEISPDTKQLLEQDVPYVWCLAADKHGNVYAGTGNEGKVLRIDAGGKAKPFFAADDLLVLSLAIDADGNVYAGTGPKGLVYRIDPKGEGKLLYKGSDPYIWGLAFTPDGSLYAATGDAGRLLKISRDGKADVVFDSTESHLLCIGVDAAGNVYFATEGRGRVYRIDKAGKAFALYEAAENEIRCLAIDKQGAVYVGTATGVKATVPPPKRPEKPKETPPPPPGEGSEGPAKKSAAPTPTAEAKGGAGEDDGSVEAPKQPKGPGETISATNCVYRIDRDGNVRKVFDRQGSVILSLLATDNGLMVGTGNEGKIYLVDSQDDATMLMRTDEAQTTAMVGAGSGIYFGTANMGNVYKQLAAHAPMGIYTSMVHDAEFTAHWGRLTWSCVKPRGTKITVATRSGNVKEPDSTWGDWSPESDEGEGAVVRSAPARFIQYRFTLHTSDRSATPQVDHVVLSYLTANQAPRVEQIGPTLPKEAPPGQASYGGKVKLSWKATDPNGDELRYTLHFKGEAEKDWKPLKSGLNATTHDWDTDAVPDGVYRVKVTASDSPANPTGRALASSLVSEAFTIDNTGPQVLKLSAKVLKGKSSVDVTAELSDALSWVKSGRYSVDAGEWQALLPEDGVFDSPRETVKFTSNKLTPGEHTLVVQATDDAGNVGSGKTVFVVE